MIRLWGGLIGAVLMALTIAMPACAEDRPAARPTSLTAEFEAPYAIGVVAGGTIIDISGSFSWAMPQNFIAVLARAPLVRTIRFDSPGGHVQPAMQIAAIIRSRGLDTYVPQFCASACTLAFLAGKSRLLAPTARLGFHQAHAPGMPPERFDPMLRAAYEKAGVPEGFIDHVLRTPPASIWFPTQPELHGAGLTTGIPPAAISGADNAVSLARRQAIRLLPATKDATVGAVAEIFSLMVEQLQIADPETCRGYFHRMPTDLRKALKRPVLDAMANAEQQVSEDARGSPTPAVDPAVPRQARESLLGALREALRLDGDHAGFCPAWRRLLAAARALPDPGRGQALRGLLIGRHRLSGDPSLV